MAYDLESSATILVLLALISIYLYILLAPSLPHLPPRTRNFVIPDDTLENFNNFIKGGNEWKYTDDFSSAFNYSGSNSGFGNAHDDFFLFEGGNEGTS